MGRMDFPSGEEGYKEFKKFVEQYVNTNKMKLIITAKGEAILRTRLATRYDSARIMLNEQQIKDLEAFVKDKIEVWHLERWYWDEEVKEKREE